MKRRSKTIPISSSVLIPGGSTDWTGDSINGEQDAVVKKVLSRQPELSSRYSRCQIYRMVERGEIDVPNA